MAERQEQNRFTALDTSFTALHLCTTCGANYQTASGLRKHSINKHTYEHPHKSCGKGFLDRGAYEAHCRSQHNKLKMKCPVCKKEFSTKSTLNRHVTNTHQKSTEEPLKCQVCSLTFRRKDELDDHNKGAHEKQQRFSCNYCGKRYAWRASLHRHTTTCQKKHCD